MYCPRLNATHVTTSMQGQCWRLSILSDIQPNKELRHRLEKGLTVVVG